MTVRDSYTIEIARSIADTVEELLGARPYLVINNLNRSSDKAIQCDTAQQFTVLVGFLEAGPQLHCSHLQAE